MNAYRPRFQEQGPADNCVLQGRLLGWLSCTAYACAPGIERSTHGAKHPSGCEVRAHTGDVSGGLTLPQVARVAKAEYGVDMEVRVGSNVCSPEYAAMQLRKGRPALVQGNTGALIGTPHASTYGAINHAVYVNEVRGGTTYAPKEALVYDPAADGRASFAQGPQWWPWEVLERFAASLRPWGESDPRILGSGRMYAGFYPDTEPRIVYRYAGRATAPQPVRFLAKAPAGRLVNVRAGPGLRHPIVFHLKPGGAGNTGRFWAFQLTTSGQKLTGRKGEKWYGNAEGTAWVHETGVVKA